MIREGCRKQHSLFFQCPPLLDRPCFGIGPATCSRLLPGIPDQSAAGNDGLHQRRDTHRRAASHASWRRSRGLQAVGPGRDHGLEPNPATGFARLNYAFSGGFECIGLTHFVDGGAHIGVWSLEARRGSIRHRAEMKPRAYPLEPGRNHLREIETQPRSQFNRLNGTPCHAIKIGVEGHELKASALRAALKHLLIDRVPSHWLCVDTPLPGTQTPSLGDRALGGTGCQHQWAIAVEGLFRAPDAIEGASLSNVAAECHPSTDFPLDLEFNNSILHESTPTWPAGPCIALGNASPLKVTAANCWPTRAITPFRTNRSSFSMGMSICSTRRSE